MKKVKFKNKENKEILLDCNLYSDIITCDKNLIDEYDKIWLYHDELIFEYELGCEIITGECNYFEINNYIFSWKIRKKYELYFL